MRRPRIMLLVAVVFAAFTTVGCATANRYEGMPDDFSVEAVVYPSSDAADAAGVDAVHYVLLADGSLHARVGSGAWAGRLPGEVRKLTGRQMFNIWNASAEVRQGELGGDEVDYLAAEAPPAAGVAYLIWIRSFDREEAWRWDSEVGPPAAVESLFTALETAAMLRR
ncbi:MAG: hypothetical protein ACF8PN_16590 [Phycisphaerales bacterium]